MDANRALAARVAELETEIAALKQQTPWRILKKPQAAVVAGDGAPLPPPPAPPPPPPGPVRYAIAYFLLPILVLLIVHYLMIIRFDLNPLFLRAASILIPLPFGISLFRRTAPRLLPSIVMGMFCGLVAVSGMLTVVGVIDNVPIIPADMVEWRESIEYALSIALAFLLGALLLQTWRILRAKMDQHIDQQVAQALAMGFVGDLATFIAEKAGIGKSKSNIGQRIQAIEKLVTSAMTSATAAGSIYAGIKAFL